MVVCIDSCTWILEGGQFAGGPFFVTSCKNYFTVLPTTTPLKCPACNKSICFIEATDERTD